MNTLKNKITFLMLLLFFLYSVPAAMAQFKISRSTFGSGGGASTGTGLRLTSTVSQNFIGAPVNGKFANLVGFWYQKPIDIPTTVEENNSDMIPTTYRLEQNYPNPFNPSTNISFALPEAGHVSLKIYNIVGQQIATLVDQDLDAGKHNVVFIASNLPSGMYLYRLQAGDFIQIRKLTLLK